MIGFDSLRHEKLRKSDCTFGELRLDLECTVEFESTDQIGNSGIV